MDRAFGGLEKITTGLLLVQSVERQAGRYSDQQNENEQRGFTFHFQALSPPMTIRAHVPDRNVRPIFDPLEEPVGVSDGVGSGLWGSRPLPALPGWSGERERRGGGHDRDRRRRSGEDRRDRAAAIAATVTAAEARATTATTVIGSLGHGGVERLVQVDRREVDAALPSTSMTRTLISSPSLTASSGRRTGGTCRWLTCTSPSLPGAISTKAPMPMRRVTLPLKIEPTSTSPTMPRMMSRGAAAGRLIDGGDEDLTVLLNVDLRAGVGGDLLDHLAARPDHLADPLGIDLDGEDAKARISLRCLARLRSIASAILPRICSRPWRACSRALNHHFARQALDLGVQLDGGDAFGRSGDLEVHVAGEVLHALDVGEDGELVVRWSSGPWRRRRPAP